LLSITILHQPLVVTAILQVEVIDSEGGRDGGGGVGRGNGGGRGMRLSTW